jgi:hypothetical protein
MRRTLPVALIYTAAISGGVIAAIALFIAVFDWNAARGAIERAAEKRTGRSVVIGGGLDLRLGWPPRLIADQVRVSNPPWAQRPDVLTAERIVVTPSLRSILRGRLAVDELVLVGPSIALEVHGEGRSWALGREGTGPRPTIGRMRIENGQVEYLDPVRDTAITAQVSAGGGGGDDDLSVQASGRLRGEAFQMAMTGQAVVRLADRSTPYPLRAVVRSGSTRAEITGTVTGLPAPTALDVHLSIAGDDLASLRRLVGLNAPPTPPYRLDGRLRRDHSGWHVEDARGRIGDSDVAGRMSFTPSPRPLLTGQIVSEELDFDDLGPLIGAPPRTVRGETASPAQRREAQRMKEADRALPTKPFDPARLQRMDVDVRLLGRRVLHPPALPIESLETRLRITEGRLRLDPLRMRVAGGETSGTVELDAREQPLRGAVTLELRGLRLDRLFPTVDAMRKSRGLAHGRVNLTGRGDSIAGLLASADGRVSLAVDRGRISNLVLELLGLDAGEAVLLLAAGDRDVALRCAVADLSVHDGVGTSNVLVLDTDDTLVVGAGAVSFGRERLDLTLYPQPKDRSVLAARAPLHVRGSLRDPQVVPDAKSLATRGITAALLALVNPLLALAPFIETGPGKDSDCAGLVARARSWRDRRTPAPAQH